MSTAPSFPCRATDPAAERGRTGAGTGTGGGGTTVTTPARTTPLTRPRRRVSACPGRRRRARSWALLDCIGGDAGAGPQAVLVNIATGAPAITPQQLLDPGAWASCRSHTSARRMAPPRGSDGLVGLPEWFWLPAGEWTPQQRDRVTAGPVWATATAAPVGLTLRSGAGLNAIGLHRAGDAIQPAQASRAASTPAARTPTSSPRPASPVTRTRRRSP